MFMTTRRFGATTRRFGAGLTSAVVALGPGLAAAGDTPAAAQPGLVLVISVDQMRADYLTRFGPVFTGGFKRLLERGAVFVNARFRHASTETGPGHAVLLSGRSPRSSGIVANSWYDRVLRRRVNVVDDPTVEPVGGPGRGASPAHFVGFTLGDMLKRRTPAARVVGASFKDRAAVLMAGPRADAAYWYSSDAGHFVTSTYYMRSAPGWLTAWNARRPADAFAGRAWERLRPDEGLYLRLAGPDRVAGESDGTDTVFPHVLRARPPAREYYEGLWRTPFADELLLDFVREVVRRHELGTRGVTDLLAVGFSATDVVGHTYGPDSQELLDQLLRLDRVLDQLLSELEGRVGAGRLLVVLSSDHGVSPLPEVLQARGVAGARREPPQALIQPVTAALEAHFPGRAGLVARLDDGGATLDRDALVQHGLRQAEVEAVVAKALLGTGLVAAVYDHARLAGDPDPADPYLWLYQRAFFAPRTPDLVVRLEQHVYLDEYAGGTGHGSSYEDDRHVPIVFMGAGIKPGARADECGPEDLALTLASLLNLDYPRQDAERDLAPLLR